VEAKDTVALRAALNAYLRWIGSAIKVLQVVELSAERQKGKY
jgi:tRNA threonylcarbamoyladenosine modification (KEOPS) complex  Pcc1 subunit